MKPTSTEHAQAPQVLSQRLGPLTRAQLQIALDRFDSMIWAFGDGQQDLPRSTARFALADLEPARSFIAAYRERQPLPAGCHERLRLYMLWDRLVLWQYGRRNRVWFPENARFRDFASGFLSLHSIPEKSSS